MIFSKKPRDLTGVAPIMLNEDPLPWVKQLKHLGNILQCDNSMEIDCAVKRGKFIGKVNSLLQEFHYVDPSVKIKIYNIFATSFYGSGLWDIFSKDVDRIFKFWNVSVRIAFDIPCTSHRYLMEPLSKSPHPKTMLSSRLVKFQNSLCSSSKKEVYLLGNLAIRDNRTVLGKTMSRLKRELECQELNSSLIKEKMKYFPTPEGDKWRIEFLDELIAVRSNKMILENFSHDDVSQMIDALCTS